MIRLIMFAGIIVSLLACTTPVKQQHDVLKLEVDGEQWIAVVDFSNSTADDKHYVVQTEEDGTVEVKFGDGVHGARLPAGTSEIRTRYSRGRHYVGVRSQQGRVVEKECK